MGSLRKTMMAPGTGHGFRFYRPGKPWSAPLLPSFGHGGDSMCGDDLAGTLRFAQGSLDNCIYFGLGDRRLAIEFIQLPLEFLEVEPQLGEVVFSDCLCVRLRPTL